MSRMHYTPLITLAYALACGPEPTTPSSPPASDLAGVGNTDASRVITVGVDAPANLVVQGTVAGIVVTTDNAVIDLSKAIVDCTGQTTTGEKIGVWIQGNRTNVHIRGGGTGIVRNCNIGVLTGQLQPQIGVSGGSRNRVDGLAIINSFGGPEGFGGYGLVVSDEHDDFVNGNTITNASQGGVFLFGSTHSAAVAGDNSLTGNVIEGVGDSGIVVSTDANTIRANRVAGWFYNVLVSGDNNLISGNQLGLLGPSCGCVGVWLHEQADRNVVRDNEVTETQFGFLVEQGTFGNLLTGNTATAADPLALDAFDRSGDCIDNTWARNTFTTADPGCILAGPGPVAQALLSRGPTVEVMNATQ